MNMVSGTNKPIDENNGKDIDIQTEEKILAYRENMRQWFSDFFIKFDKTSHKEWFDNGHDTDKSRKAWINRVYNNKKNTV